MWQGERSEPSVRNGEAMKREASAPAARGAGRYKMTHSLLEQWLRATDSEADEGAFDSFLATLERRPRERSKAMQAGIDFENAVTRYVNDVPPGEALLDKTELRAIVSFGNALRGGSLQVRQEAPLTVEGVPLLLVGVADCLKAGVLYDIKRVQRYEYGKHAGSTQHPMYFELFPEATRFDYLIFDGYYCYREQYRRGDYPPIAGTITAFLRYLRDADLMDVYQQHWEVPA